jgi:pimeloyl-ACP methyl ester carboxylesterase
MSGEADIRPFQVDMPDDAIAGLRRRVAAWRPPEREPVDDQSQGVQLATVQDLANYWATEYDWRLFAGHAYGAITRDDWLDNTSLYWLTDTATSAARLYWQLAAAGKNFYAAADVSLPAAVTVFPDEYVHAPRTWTEQAYHNLIYLNEAEKGGHFAAWEQPQVFSEELRAAFRTLR